MEIILLKVLCVGAALLLGLCEGTHVHINESYQLHNQLQHHVSCDHLESLL